MKGRLSTMISVTIIGGLLIPGMAFGKGPQHPPRGPKPKPGPTPSPTTDCSSYPQKRQFVEAQGWWTQTPGKDGTDFGHVHVGACIPERETISGISNFNIRVILHDNPGTLRYVALVVKGAGYETTVAKPTISNFTCPRGTCEGWLFHALDTKAFEHSGRQEIRFRAIVDTPDGNSMHAGLNFQAYVDNGKPFDDYEREPHLRGKGWYTGAGYCEGTFESVPVPDDPVSGTWSPLVKMVEHSTGQFNDPVSHHTVRLDANFHEGIEGTILEDGAGEFHAPIDIDTTRLTNGVHKLLIRSDCDDPRGSTNSGLLVLPFEVAN